MVIPIFLVSGIFLFVVYLLTILLETYYGFYMKKVKKLFLREKESKQEFHRINQKYFVFLIVIVLFGVMNYICGKLDAYSHQFWYPTILFRRILLASFFFLLGYLFAHRKKIISYFFDCHVFIIRTLILTLTSIMLLTIQASCIELISIVMALMNLIYLAHYFYVFQKNKEQLLPKEFVFQFLWILLIQFLNSMVFIYDVWNVLSR